MMVVWLVIGVISSLGLAGISVAGLMFSRKSFDQIWPVIVVCMVSAVAFGTMSSRFVRAYLPERRTVAEVVERKGECDE
jgi:predicted Fe-Mo cluster-binding NifX family protein